MKRVKRLKIKREIPESSSQLKDKEEHDLAYYIHDRVELMHQVFSVIKPKELKLMAPQCVYNISIDNLQELCTEELLGISSKRLCAILDGADPPTDTESSCSEPLETISLDSISSDDAVLSQNSSKPKKHKHKKHKSKNKHKRRESNSETEADKSKASRSGLTVLELLELQARARAIRAQLQKDVNSTPEVQQETREKNDSSDEIEIKEEPPEVVEISSEDEKPKIKDLPVKPRSPSEEKQQQSTSTFYTKKVNDLIITVPQSAPTRKIILKRNRPAACTSTADVSTKNIENVNKEVVTNKVQVIPDNEKNNTQKNEKINTQKNDKENESKTETKAKPKRKQKKKNKGKEGSDHDEITLQLSDSEKMDLLNFDRQNYDNLTSSGSEDSESSSDSSESDNKSTKSTHYVHDMNKPSKENTVVDQNTDMKSQIKEKEKDDEMKENHEVKEASPINLDNEEAMEKTDLSDTINEVSPVLTEKDQEKVKSSEQNNSNTSADNQPNNEQPVVITKPQEQIEDGEIINEEENKLSEGEISDHTADIVCISDDENISKKKKKKEKKSKKDKKKKSKLDFREDADQNFFTEQSNEDQKPTDVNKVLIDDDIYEILELSDDSSCYEVEGVSISKEPTKAEIEALSAKIDEKIHTNTCEESEKNEANTNEDIENISWRDRYLDSTKVKKVLTTSNIINALRKKNKELKKKLEESKNMEEKAPGTGEPADVGELSSNLVEGSIEHFNTLQGSTKYVDTTHDNKVTKELEMDAKRLLKMYKKLLKYGDTHTKDPNKKKKKKQKKNKEKKKSNDTTQENITSS